jgi:hypothetical protein
MNFDGFSAKDFNFITAVCIYNALAVTIYHSW